MLDVLQQVQICRISLGAKNLHRI